MAQARTLIRELFGKGKPSAQTPKPYQLLSELERVLGLSKSEWPIELLRTLWGELKRGITRRGRSIHHEVSWLSLAGYCLRPGYGFEADEKRIEELWRLYDLGPSHRKEARVAVQWWILWRRVAGGLNANQQAKLFKQARKVISNKGDGYLEAYRLLGSLERVAIEKRVELAQTLVRQFAKGREAEATVWAFGRLASRVPVYGETSSVIEPDYVEQWFEEIADSQWSDNMKQAFRLIARCSEHERQNLSSSTRNLVKQKLRGGGVGDEDLVVLDTYIPLKTADERSVYGEELPLGLSL